MRLCSDIDEEMGQGQEGHQFFLHRKCYDGDIHPVWGNVSAENEALRHERNGRVTVLRKGSS